MNQPLMHLAEAACTSVEAAQELDRLLAMRGTKREMERESRPFVAEYCARCPAREACGLAGARLGDRGMWGGKWRNRPLVPYRVRDRRRS